MNPTELQDMRRTMPDWWLGAASMPASARADWLHVLCVAHEIERIPEKTREPMIAQIRLAWWRELIGEIYAGQVPRPHPLAPELAALIPRHAIPYALWEGWLEAMSERFDPQENADLPSTEEWLFAIAAHLLHAPMDTPRDAEPWQELGRLWTLLHGLRLQAFSSDPQSGMVREAALAGLTCPCPEPQNGKKFWHTQRKIARHYLQAASRAKDTEALHHALRPSRVLLPLKLLFA